MVKHPRHKLLVFVLIAAVLLLAIASPQFDSGKDNTAGRNMKMEFSLRILNTEIIGFTMRQSSSLLQHKANENEEK